MTGPMAAAAAAAAAAQVCAAGALLNILGPELDALPEGCGQRRALGRIMSLVMAVSIVHECVFDRPLILE